MRDRDRSIGRMKDGPERLRKQGDEQNEKKKYEQGTATGGRNPLLERIKVTEVEQNNNNEKREETKAKEIDPFLESIKITEEK